MPSSSFQHEVGPVCRTLCKALRFGVDLGMWQSSTRCLFLDIDANEFRNFRIVMAKCVTTWHQNDLRPSWKNQQVGLDFLNKVFVGRVVVALFSSLMVADSKKLTNVIFVFPWALRSSQTSLPCPCVRTADSCAASDERCFRPKQLLWTRLSRLDGGCETLPGSDRFRGCLWGKTARLCVDTELPTCFQSMCSCGDGYEFRAKKFLLLFPNIFGFMQDSHRVDRQNPVDRVNII